jgi:hypothetical protein
MNGLGILKFANGNTCEGWFNAGKCEGDGILKFANGDIYEGYF